MKHSFDNRFSKLVQFESPPIPKVSHTFLLPFTPSGIFVCTDKIIHAYELFPKMGICLHCFLLKIGGQGLPFPYNNCPPIGIFLAFRQTTPASRSSIYRPRCQALLLRITPCPLMFVFVFDRVLFVLRQRDLQDALLFQLPPAMSALRGRSRTEMYDLIILSERQKVKPESRAADDAAHPAPPDARGRIRPRVARITTT